MNKVHSGWGNALSGIEGRSISPRFVEDIIETGKVSRTIEKGVERLTYASGSGIVVCEEAGKVVITVIPSKK